MWERPVISLNVKVADCLDGITPPEQGYAQLSARLTLQVHESPIAPKAGHAVEVMRNHNHLPISNVEGVSSVPPPLN